MKREEIISILNNLEKQYCVTGWKINGIDIWPALKIKIFFFNFYKFLDKNDGVKQFSKKSSFVGTVVKAVSGFLQFKFKKFTENDVMYSEAMSHYDISEGVRVSKFFYPIELFLNKNAKSKVSFSRTIYGQNISENTYKKKEVIEIEKYALSYNLINLMKMKLKIKVKYEQRTENLDAVFQYLKTHQLAPNETLTEFQNYLYSIAQEITTYSIIYKKILRQSRPKLILELCYYTSQNYALNIEARKLNIPTLELMHGGIGKLHIAYCGWENAMPNEGYNILPQKIWLWDEETKIQLDPWIQMQSFHQTLVAGNPWLNYIIAQNQDNTPSFLKSNKKKLLFTLQFDTIDEYIYDAIAQSPNDYEWWLRLHPRKQHAKNSILQKLNSLKLIHKVNIEDVNTLPLPTILNHCSIHLSESSGSIIEAALLGKRSIILSEVGVDTYQAYINAGICMVSISKSSTDLMNTILNMEINKFELKQKKIEYSVIFEDII